MCGISVLVNINSGPANPELLRKMNHAIRHRGPDGEGYYLDKNVGLGHQMLKITDLSNYNVQPMHFSNYVITYNGEIYNFRILREELRKFGYEFHTDTDTEVILAAYDKWQEECVHRLNGMWSFVIYDRIRNSLFCSRDRFGIKPLCYTSFNNKFLVGSEIKQFTSLEDFTPRLNQKAAYNFIYLSKLNNGNETFFEQVHNLPAGHNLIYDLESHTYVVNKWYTIRDISPNHSISFREATEYFRELFFESMIQHLYTKVPVGSCLSGGIDTTTMLGVTNKVGNYVTTYSSCINESAYNEIEYIDKAISYYNLPNRKVFPDINQLLSQDLLGVMVYHQDQPVLDGSFFSEYKIYETAAREKVRVMLSGQGADEYLGGYGEFYQLYLKTLLMKGNLPAFVREIGHQPKKFRFLKNFIFYNAVFPLSKRLQFSSKHQNFMRDCFSKEWLNEHLELETEKAKRSNFHDLSIDALTNYSLPHQLHSEDRNSMGHSIESRLPFLDHRLVEFCLSLPDNFKIRNGISKYILRESMKPLLPVEIYARRSKLGFPGPEESLFMKHYHSIREIYKSCIGNFPEIFDVNLLRTYEAYAENRMAYNPIFFRILSFAAWAKVFGVAPAMRKFKRAEVLSMS